MINPSAEELERRLLEALREERPVVWRHFRSTPGAGNTTLGRLFQMKRP